MDLFGSLGSTSASFSARSTSSGVPVGGNRLPGTRRYTAHAGAQYALAVTSAATAFVRGDVTVNGRRHFDELNRASQDAYSIANVLFGVRGERLLGEGWIRNAFDTLDVPVTIPYGALAPSGFVGEPGAPRTFGIRAGISF